MSTGNACPPRPSQTPANGSGGPLRGSLYWKGYSAGYVHGARWGLVAGVCWASLACALAAWLFISTPGQRWLPW